MPQFPLRLPSRNEAALIGLAVLALLFASWLRRGEKISSLEAQLAAKPMVEFRDRVVEKRVVEKGPVHFVKVVAPDGTKTTTVDRAAVVVTTDKASDHERKETPICPQPHRAPTRYFGPTWGKDGFAGSWVKGARGGINVMENWDLGGNLSRERDGAVVVGAETIFRW